MLPAARGAETPEEIVGRWLFYKKVYDGVEFPEGPGATLRMEFEFLPNGESLLSWRRQGEKGYCARKGRYHTEGGHLVEEVIWVDPQNAYGCADDPDMQLGRRTRTEYFFSGADLGIRFYLGEEPLDLIWKKQIAEAR